MFSVIAAAEIPTVRTSRVVKPVAGGTSHGKATSAANAKASCVTSGQIRHAMGRDIAFTILVTRLRGVKRGLCARSQFRMPGM